MVTDEVTLNFYLFVSALGLSAAWFQGECVWKLELAEGHRLPRVAVAQQ